MARPTQADAIARQGVGDFRRLQLARINCFDRALSEPVTKRTLEIVFEGREKFRPRGQLRFLRLDYTGRQSDRSNE